MQTARDRKLERLYNKPVGDWTGVLLSLVRRPRSNYYLFDVGGQRLRVSDKIPTDIIPIVKNNRKLVKMIKY